jgi:hypothetical protein
MYLFGDVSATFNPDTPEGYGQMMLILGPHPGAGVDRVFLFPWGRRMLRLRHSRSVVRHAVPDSGHENWRRIGKAVRQRN